METSQEVLDFIDILQCFQTNTDLKKLKYTGASFNKLFMNLYLIQRSNVPIFRSAPCSYNLFSLDDCDALYECIMIMKDKGLKKFSCLLDIRESSAMYYHQCVLHVDYINKKIYFFDPNGKGDSITRTQFVNIEYLVGRKLHDFTFCYLEDVCEKYRSSLHNIYAMYYYLERYTNDELRTITTDEIFDVDIKIYGICQILCVFIYDILLQFDITPDIIIETIYQYLDFSKFNNEDFIDNIDNRLEMKRVSTTFFNLMSKYYVRTYEYAKNFLNSITGFNHSLAKLNKKRNKKQFLDFEFEVRSEIMEGYYSLTENESYYKSDIRFLENMYDDYNDYDD